MAHELYIAKDGENQEMLDTIMTGMSSGKKGSSVFGVTFAIGDSLTKAHRIYFRSYKALSEAKIWCLRFANERGIPHNAII